MKIMGNESKTEIHITEIGNKYLYDALLDEIAMTKGFFQDTATYKKINATEAFVKEAMK